MKDLKCKYCDTNLDYNPQDNKYHCPYCGACFDAEEDFSQQEDEIEAQKETIRQQLRNQINKTENNYNQFNDISNDFNDTENDDKQFDDLVNDFSDNQVTNNNDTDYQRNNVEEIESETNYSTSSQPNANTNKKHRFKKSSLLIFLIILLSVAFILANVFFKE